MMMGAMMVMMVARGDFQIDDGNHWEQWLVNVGLNHLTRTMVVMIMMMVQLAWSTHHQLVLKLLFPAFSGLGTTTAFPTPTTASSISHVFAQVQLCHHLHHRHRHLLHHLLYHHHRHLLLHCCLLVQNATINPCTVQSSPLLTFPLQKLFPSDNYRHFVNECITAAGDRCSPVNKSLHKRY